MSKNESHTTTTNFMYFVHNHPRNWIQTVWADNPRMADHFASKLDSYRFDNTVQRYGNAENIFKLYMNMTDEHRGTLITWINNNYNYKA